MTRGSGCYYLVAGVLMSPVTVVRSQYSGTKRYNILTPKTMARC